MEFKRKDNNAPTLEDLFFGNIDPTNEYLEDDEFFHSKAKEVISLQNKVANNLPPELIDPFTDYINEYILLTVYMEQQMFKYAFALGQTLKKESEELLTNK